MKNTILLIGLIIIQIDCFSQKEEKPIFIFYENNMNGMFKEVDINGDIAFYYTIKLDRPFWYGFESKKNERIISNLYFYNDSEIVLRDIHWIRNLSANYPDSLREKENLYIVEMFSKDSLRLVAVKFFTEME
jgi:hypothetical protein